MAGDTVAFQVQFSTGPNGRRALREGVKPRPADDGTPAGRVPRVARLMSLAVRLDDQVRSGAIRDYAEAARLGGVTRARMSQIAGLLNLASDLQSAVLHLPPVVEGRDDITERDLRSIAILPDWGRQRELWSRIVGIRQRPLGAVIVEDMTTPP